MFFVMHTKGKSLFRKAEEGVTAIEMALIAPAFFVFFLGVVELSLVFVTQQLLENATFNASRLGKTGYVATGSTQLDTVKAKLYDELAALSPLIDSSKVAFTTVSYSSFATMTSTGSSGLGSSGQIVVYQVSYPWTFFTPVISNLMGSTTISARLVVKNEPYD